MTMDENDLPDYLNRALSAARQRQREMIGDEDEDEMEDEVGDPNFDPELQVRCSCCAPVLRLPELSSLLRIRHRGEATPSGVCVLILIGWAPLRWAGLGVPGLFRGGAVGGERQ